MGSCVSKKDCGTGIAARIMPAAANPHLHPLTDSRPLEEEEEEEKVKEVLSETPRLKSRPLPPTEQKKPVKLRKEECNSNRFDKFQADEELAAASETASMSECLSFSTATTVEKTATTADGEEVEQVKSSAASTAAAMRTNNNKGEETRKKDPNSRPPTAYKSSATSGSSRKGQRKKRSILSGELPGCRSQRAVAVTDIGCRSGGFSRQSPVKKRSQALETSSDRRTQHSSASSNADVNGNAIRRDAGERSGRRSISPAKKMAPTTADVQRQGSGGKGSSSVKRIPPPSRTPMPPRRDCAESNGSEQAAGNKESLDNPSVAMECFIFL